MAELPGVPQELWNVLARLDRDVSWKIQSNHNLFHLSVVWRTNNENNYQVPRKSKTKKSVSRIKRDKERLNAWKDRQKSLKSQQKKETVYISKSDNHVKNNTRDRCCLSEHRTDTNQAENNLKTGNKDLDIGDLVLLRNKVSGLNKLQDIWHPTPYRVMARIKPDGSAYVVQRSDDTGPKRAINRVDLLEFRFPDEDTLNETDDPLQLNNTPSSDSDSSNDEDLVFRIQEPIQPTLTEDRPQLRSSSRANRGQHSNIHNLPRSVLNQSHIQNNILPSYPDYSHAILDL
jgi:hypothetical protein